MSDSETPSAVDGVDVTGPEDAPSIVFVHGAIFTRAMWAPQRRALADDYRVIALDLPGHGTRADEGFRFDPAVAVVRETIERLTEGSAMVVGLSLGGYVATTLAHRHPDLVEGLVLSGSSANPVRGMNLLTRATGGLARLVTKSDRLNRGIGGLATRWVTGLENLTPLDQQEIIDAGIYPSQFGTAAPFLAGTDFRDQLSTYPGPTLILNGENDAIMRRGEDAHLAAAQQGHLGVIEDVGHVCNLHRPATYSATVAEFARDSVLATQ